MTSVKQAGVLSLITGALENASSIAVSKPFAMTYTWKFYHTNATAEHISSLNDCTLNQPKPAHSRRNLASRTEIGPSTATLRRIPDEIRLTRSLWGDPLYK